MRLLYESDMRDLALGAAVLGTGGGGDPYLGMLLAIQAIQKYGPVKLISLDELKDDDLVASAAYVGAPTAWLEKTSGIEEMVNAFEALQKYLGRTITATISAEIGGANSIAPLGVAAAMGLPLVDADGMGRAFPEIPLVIWTLHGISATPMAMTDEKGNSIILETIDNHWTERFARSIVNDMGAMSSTALYSASGAKMREASVPGSITRAMTIGQVIRETRAAHGNVVDTVLEATDGVRLFHGKIVDVLRRTERGWAKGEATIEGLDGYAGQTLKLFFQNENLIAFIDDEVAAVVPDLITTLDAETGEPVTTELLRYGYRVQIVGIPCHPEWRTPEGLALGGPAHFGYEVEYVPVEQRALESG